MRWVQAAVAPVLVAAGFTGLSEAVWDAAPDPGAVAWGVVGWTVALMLRVPAVAAWRSTGNQESVARRVVLLSGLAEEPVRLALVLWVARTAPLAFALGVGWGLVEAAYHAVEAAALSRLLRGGGLPAEAQEMLRAMGIATLVAEGNAWWRVVERLSATALHAAFGLLMVSSPWVVLITVLLHSSANVLFLRLCRISVPCAELTLAGLAAGLLAVGLGLGAS
jgi:hypothetical protein